jgi:hypothetical protein
LCVSVLQCVRRSEERVLGHRTRDVSGGCDVLFRWVSTRSVVVRRHAKCVAFDLLSVCDWVNLSRPVSIPSRTNYGLSLNRE